MRTMWELREEPRTRGTVHTIVSFPLNLASGHELYPGSLAGLQGTIACPQPPQLELDPAETGMPLRAYKGLFSQRLIQQVQQAAALHFSWTSHTKGYPV